MSRDTLQMALRFAEKVRPSLVDVTGGEPTLYPHLRELLESAHAAHLTVRVRTNLVAMARPEAADLPELFARTGTQVLGSLPCHTAAGINGPRADSAWATSIAVLRTLTSLGYGTGDGLVLELAHNPALTELPREQAVLEAEFRLALDSCGVSFDRLLSIANVPVGRLRERLQSKGLLSAYQELLRDGFNPAVVPGLECRHGLEIGWDGTLWDCDFNLAAGLPPASGPLTLAEVAEDPSALTARRIAFGPHCYACTAGAGSS